MNVREESNVERLTVGGVAVFMVRASVVGTLADVVGGGVGVTGNVFVVLASVAADVAVVKSVAAISAVGVVGNRDVVGNVVAVGNVPGV